ncbi:MAG: DUF1559 domain-containing protein [Gemmataceae bacterium]
MIVSRRSRQGFTLIELLVVMAILAVLIALLLPAIQKIRDTAARTRCMNNLRQIGLAMQAYHNKYGYFPPGLDSTSTQYRYLSWMGRLLPFIDQEPLWQQTQAAYKVTSNPWTNPPHTAFSTVLPLLFCAADTRQHKAEWGDPIQGWIYAAYTGYLGVSGLDLNNNTGVLFNKSRVGLAEITDGAARTLMVGERPPSADLATGWWYAGAGQPPSWTGSCDVILGVQEKNTMTSWYPSCSTGPYKYGPGSIGNPCDQFHFWSMHAGGSNFLFADGHVEFVNYEGAATLPALASRAGRD